MVRHNVNNSQSFNEYEWIDQWMCYWFWLRLADSYPLTLFSHHHAYNKVRMYSIMKFVHISTIFDSSFSWCPWSNEKSNTCVLSSHFPICTIICMIVCACVWKRFYSCVSVWFRPKECVCRRLACSLAKSNRRKKGTMRIMIEEKNREYSFSAHSRPWPEPTQIIRAAYTPIEQWFDQSKQPEIRHQSGCHSPLWPFRATVRDAQLIWNGYSGRAKKKQKNVSNYKIERGRIMFARFFMNSASTVAPSKLTNCMTIVVKKKMYSDVYLCEWFHVLLSLSLSVRVSVCVCEWFKVISCCFIIHWFSI